MNSKIAVITGFYKTTHFLQTLFEYLNIQTHTNFDVFVYNYLYDELPGFDSEKFRFKYHVIKLDKNIGFAGGNNAAILKAKKTYDYPYYALINDDTKPHPNWLEKLISEIGKDHLIGAVASKLVFYEKFIQLECETKTFYAGDTRQLGVRLYTNTSFANCTYNKMFFLKGFHNEENDEINTFRWTDSKFSFALPIVIEPDFHSKYKLKLFLRKNPFAIKQNINLRIGDYHLQPLFLKEDKLFYEIEIPASVIERYARFIIQNAGSGYDNGFNGFDIGSGEFDIGQYDQRREVNMFCGGACLLSKSALSKTGIFNSHFFSYYEDSDLSLRIKKAGFKILYCPDAVVQHYHSATSKEWSPFFTYYVFRNKIIFSYKNFGFKGLKYSLSERIKETWLFFKWALRNRFSDALIVARLKLNIVILVDSFKGIIKYKPTEFN